MSYVFALNALLRKDNHLNYVDMDDEENEGFRLTNGVLYKTTELLIYYEYDSARADRNTATRLSQSFDRNNPFIILRKFQQILDGAYGRLILIEEKKVNNEPIGT